MNGWRKGARLVGGVTFAAGAIVVVLIGAMLAWFAYGYGAWAAALVGLTFLACALVLFRVGAGLLRGYGQIP